MKIWESINNNKREELIIKSIIWKTVIDEFKKEKSIDITSYLVSIRLKWNIVFIKTNKPIINSEALTINDIIKNSSKQKLKGIWLKFYDFDIKYI